MDSLAAIVTPTVLDLPDYLPYLELFLNLFALLSYLITILSIGLLLWAFHNRSHLLSVKKLSPTLHLFFYAHTVFALMSLPYQFYRVAWWRPEGTVTVNQYSPYVLYWFSLPELVYYGTIPCVVFLLAIERCLALKCPLWFINTHFGIIGSLVFFTVLVINTVGHLLELPLDYDQVMICQTASCTTINSRLYYQLTSKIVFSSANVGICILFLYLLHGTNKAKNLNNRVIIFTLLVELILGVLPCFVSMLLNKLNVPIGAPNSGLKGEIATFCCAVDAAACGLLYCLMFLKRKSTVAPLNILDVTAMKQVMK